MKIVVNGIYRDATEEEQKELEELFALNEEAPQEPLLQMVEEMATATTLAQMRAAAKKFLAQTE